MKKLILAICLLAIPCAASDKIWLTGKLIEEKNSTVQTYAQANGTGSTNVYPVWDLEVDAGDRIYFAQGYQKWRWSKVPHVTENATIQYRIEKDHLFIMDDKGKELKLVLIKTRMKDSATK
jgi:hypothetical protein